MTSLFSLNTYYLSYFFLLIYASSFGLPIMVSLLVVSFAAVTSTWQDLLLVFTLAVLGSTLGDCSAYWTLRIFRKKIYPLIERIPWLQKKVKTIDTLFHRYSTSTVFLTRFLFSGFGPLVNYYSGLQAMPHKKFIIAVIGGEIIYCLFYVSIGYFFRDTWNVVAEIAQNYLLASVFAVIGVFVIVYMIKDVIKHRNILGINDIFSHKH